MNEVIKTEEGDDPFMGDQSGHPFVLLFQVMQSNGKPLPIGGLTGRAMSQMLHEVPGMVPKEVMIMNDQEVVMELGGGDFYDGSFKEDTWVVPLGWTIY